MPAQPVDAETRQCLIIEDSNFDQRMMERAVRQTHQGVEVMIAPTLSDARKLLSEEEFAVIFLDNNLPDGKGANFALELSKDKTLSQIPVIIVSDWPSPFMWQKAQLAGVKGVVNKSEFSRDLILSALPPKAALH